jgi:hypothetical protein
MGIELPGYVTEPLSWIGMTWPEADEDKLFDAGQDWLNYGTTLRTQAQQSNSIAQKIPSEHQGEAVDEFTKWWNAEDGPGRNLDENAAAAELIGAGLIVMAGITLALKIAYIAQLVILAIEVAQAIATAFISFGATTAEIPGFVAATRAICREALNKVISMVEREIARLFEQAAKLLEKVGAKNLAGRSEQLAGKFAGKSIFHDLLSQADRVDVSSPLNGAHFYSGYDAEAGKSMRSYAEDATDGVTSTTLEKTPGGKYFDDMGLYKDGSPITNEQADKIWGRLSENYGRDAQGSVTAHVHNPRDGAIYTDKELPALINNPGVTSVKQIDPVTGEVIWPKGGPP